MSASIDEKLPMMGQIEKKDVLLSYPYESIKPFITLLNEAAKDEKII